MSSRIENIISKVNIPQDLDFKEGCLMLIDKPLDWTSFDVVNKIRFTLKYALDVKKIKVGHAGTLDPLASGLLLVCVGRYTKLINQLQGLDKAYEGTISLGVSTPTFDKESDPDEYFETSHISNKMIYDAANALTGKMMQIPPTYSAVRIKGQKAYSLARRGKVVEMEARPVNIKRFEITNIDGTNVSFNVECSKGTYIRSLANDFGKILNSGAHLSSLRRTRVDKYHVEDALEIEDITKIIDMLAERNICNNNLL